MHHRKRATTLLISLLCGATSLAVAPIGAAQEVVWQIGTPDGAVRPDLGALEYPGVPVPDYPPGSFVSAFDYFVGSDADPIAAPSAPGYLGPRNVCDVSTNRAECTDTTRQLNVHFTLDCPYVEMTLVYDRYGSESDRLFLDGELVATIAGPGEGRFQSFTFDLVDFLGDAVPAGAHTLTFEYAGGGAGTGHYIDYVQLVGTVDPLCGIGIDVKPGSYPNCFNANDRGVIPVAILGSEVLDVTSIDPLTLDFGGLSVRLKRNGSPQCSVEDVSGDFTDPVGAPDGFDDLVCQFADTHPLITSGGMATVTGSLVDGSPFSGSDEVCEK